MKSNICKTLPKEIIKAMVRATKQTNQDGRERGYNLYRLYGVNWIMGEHSRGERGHVGIVNYFKGKSDILDEAVERLGMFHTHPHRKRIIPSWNDVSIAIMRRLKFTCIGGRNKIRCFDNIMPYYLEADDEKILEDWLKLGGYCDIRFKKHLRFKGA